MTTLNLRSEELPDTTAGLLTESWLVVALWGVSVDVGVPLPCEVVSWMGEGWLYLLPLIVASKLRLLYSQWLQNNFFNLWTEQLHGYLLWTKKKHNWFVHVDFLHNRRFVTSVTHTVSPNLYRCYLCDVIIFSNPVSPQMVQVVIFYVFICLSACHVRSFHEDVQWLKCR